MKQWLIVAGTALIAALAGIVWAQPVTSLVLTGNEGVLFQIGGPGGGSGSPAGPPPCPGPGSARPGNRHLAAAAVHGKGAGAGREVDPATR